jgi:hypothetical protein
LLYAASGFQHLAAAVILIRKYTQRAKQLNNANSCTELAAGELTLQLGWYCCCSTVPSEGPISQSPMEHHKYSLSLYLKSSGMMRMHMCHELTSSLQTFALAKGRELCLPRYVAIVHRSKSHYARCSLTMNLCTELRGKIVDTWRSLASRPGQYDSRKFLYETNDLLSCV